MAHTIIVPTEITNLLYEGQLPFTPGAIETARKQGGDSVPRDLASVGPTVSLGQPQYWNLASLAREKGEALPAELTLLLRESDFYLVQLACSPSHRPFDGKPLPA